MSSSVGPSPPVITIRSAHAERRPQQLGQLLDVVAGDELEPDVDADFVQPLGDEQGIAYRRGRASTSRVPTATMQARIDAYPVTAMDQHQTPARSARFA